MRPFWLITSTCIKYQLLGHLHGIRARVNQYLHSTCTMYNVEGVVIVALLSVEQATVSPTVED